VKCLLGKEKGKEKGKKERKKKNGRNTFKDKVVMKIDIPGILRNFASEIGRSLKSSCRTKYINLRE